MSSFSFLNSNSSDQALENECPGITSIPMEQTQPEDSKIDKSTVENSSCFDQNPMLEVKTKCSENDLDQDIIIKEEFRCDRPGCIASQKKLRISRRWNRFYKQNLINIDKVLHLISELENEKRKNLDLQLAYDQRSREWSQQQEQLIQLLNEIQPLRERLRNAEESVVEEKKMRLKHQYLEESQKVAIQQLQAKVADLQTIAKPLFVENLGKKLTNCRSENKKIRCHLESSRGEIEQLRSYISDNHKNLEKLSKKYLRALEFGQNSMEILTSHSENSSDYTNEGKVLRRELEETRVSLKFQYDHFRKSKKEKLKGRKLALSHILSFSEWVRDCENVTKSKKSDDEDDSEAKSEEEFDLKEHLLASSGKKEKEKQSSCDDIASEANKLEMLSAKSDVKECQSDEDQSTISKGIKKQKGKQSSAIVKKTVNHFEKGDAKDSEMSLKKSPTKRGRMSQMRSPTVSPLSQTNMLKEPQNPVSVRSLHTDSQTASIFDESENELSPFELNCKNSDSYAASLKTPPSKKQNRLYTTSENSSASGAVDSLSLFGDFLKNKELTPRQSSPQKRTKHPSSSRKLSTDPTCQKHSSTRFSLKVKSKPLIESSLSESSSSESDSEVPLKNKQLTPRLSSSRKRTKHPSPSGMCSTNPTHKEHSSTPYTSKLIMESSLSESSSSESDSVINKIPLPSSPDLDQKEVALSKDQKMEAIENTEDRFKIETILQVMSIDPIGISSPNLDDPKVMPDQSEPSFTALKSNFDLMSQRKSLKTNKVTPERKMNTVSFDPTQVTQYSNRCQNLDSGSSSQNTADNDVNSNPQSKNSVTSDSTEEETHAIHKLCTSHSPATSAHSFIDLKQTLNSKSCINLTEASNSNLEMKRTNKSPNESFIPQHLLRLDLSISSSDSEMEVSKEKKVNSSQFTIHEELIEGPNTNLAKRFDIPDLSLENSMSENECISFDISEALSLSATVQISPKPENVSSVNEKTLKEDNSNGIEIRSLNKRIKISNLFSDESASENSPKRDLPTSKFDFSIRSSSPSISSSSSEEEEGKSGAEDINKGSSSFDSSQNSNDEASLVIDWVEPYTRSKALPWNNIDGIHPFSPAKYDSTRSFSQETLPNLEPIYGIVKNLSSTESSSLKEPSLSAELPSSNLDQDLWKPSFYKEVKEDSLPRDCPQIIEGIFEEEPLLPEVTEETNVSQEVKTKQSVSLVRSYVLQEEMETLEGDEMHLTTLEELFQNILGTRCQSSEWKTLIKSIALYISKIQAKNTISKQQPIVKVILLCILRISPYEQCENNFSVPPTMYKLFQIVRVMEKFQKLEIFTLETLINAAAHKLILIKSLRPNSLVTLMTWFSASCTAQYNHFSPPNDEDRVHWMRTFMIDLLYHHKGLIHDALLAALNTSRKIFLKAVRCRESTVVEKVIVWIVYFGKWTGLKSSRNKLSFVLESKFKIQKPPLDFIEKILTKILEDLTAVDVHADKLATTKLGFYLLLRWFQPYRLTCNFFPLFRKVYYDESCSRVELQKVKQLLEAMIRSVKWPKREEEAFLKKLSSFPLLK